MLRVILLCTAIVSASAGGDNKTDATNNVAKREILEFYPDWVPFKNKHGDELGEFVDVTKPKAKVKKRLALPMNFLIKSLADEDSGDYVGQGESDNDDYYDKKDWSDLNRPVHNSSKPLTEQPVTVSDIDGVLNIITKAPPSFVNDIIRYRKREEDVSQDDDDTYDKKENLTELVKQYATTRTPDIESKIVHTPIPAAYKQDDDNSEVVNNQRQSEGQSQKLSSEEQKENEEKKRIILDSVDQLKTRHEEEQRAISAKNKEDEYNNQLRHKKRTNKRNRTKPPPPNYDEYENFSWDNKYNINVETKPIRDDVDVSVVQLATTPRKVRITSTTTIKPESEEQAKYSLFRNPNIYTIDGDEDDIPQVKSPNAPRRFSSKYNSANKNLITSATTTEKVEPILYFPKRKVKKSRNRSKTTTVAPDSSVAETVQDKLSTAGATETIPTTALANNDHRTTATSFNYPTTTISLWKDDDSSLDQSHDKKKLDYTDTTSGELTSAIANHQPTGTGNDLTGPSGPTGEAQASNSDTVTDAVPASSDTKEKEPKDYHVEKGGGKEHHSSFEEEHEEHGKKAYEGLHKDSKSKKGHHDKEDHLGKYEDRGGHNKEHHDESGHYGAHHHEEHGKKHAKYEESGKHSKGHSTKGSHDIHKKEEYEKNVEFFEEEGDSAEEEKHGGYHNEKKHEAGGHFKKGKLHNNHHENKKGESGHFVKGGHEFLNKGHKSADGHEGHRKRHGAHHDGGGHKSGKKWLYHHGYPAKNANLVVIDRRTDKYMHGPNYFG